MKGIIIAVNTSFMASQLPRTAFEADTPKQPEFPQPHERPPHFQMEQLLQVLSWN